MSLTPTWKTWVESPDQISPSAVQRMVADLKVKGVTNPTLDTVRCLRTAAAVRTDIRQELAPDNALINVFQRYLDGVALEMGTVEVADWIPVRCSLQYIHNVFVDEDVAPLVTIVDSLAPFLNVEDVKTVNMCASVLGHLTKCSRGSVLKLTHWQGLLGSVARDSTFGLMALQDALRLAPVDVLHHYDQLPLDGKCVLLDIIFEMEATKCDPVVIDVIKGKFKEQAAQILTTLKNTSQALEPLQVTRLLQCLIAISTEEPTGALLRADKSLLIDTLYLLRMIHEFGKENPHSPWAPIQKIAQAPAAVEENPSFGFKRDLVRLLGNLCWKHKSNQDEVRELDGIAVLLDCTSIDARNEFIKEWALFALRNLCDQNQANQDYVSKIDQKGPVQEDMLQELGIKLKL